MREFCNNFDDMGRKYFVRGKLINTWRTRACLFTREGKHAASLKVVASAHMCMQLLLRNRLCVNLCWHLKINVLIKLCSTKKKI